MNKLKNLKNKAKQYFNRSKSYPGVIKEQKHHNDYDIMEIRTCTANYCETCEEMIFQNLKKCHECKERKICNFCYDDGEHLCKDCNDILMELYDNIEKEQKQNISKLKLKKLQSGDFNDLEIKDFVDQIL